MQEKKEEDLQQALNKVFEVGIDEVGRGAIFGPVFAAAVVLPEKNKFILSPKLLDKYLSANGTINKLLKYAEIVIINNNITNSR